MRKRYRSNRLLLIVAAILLLTVGLAAQPAEARGEAEKPIQVFVDITPVSFEMDPFIQDGSTFVQFRPLFEAMGLTVEWDASARIVKGSKAGLTIELPIGKEEAFVNGNSVMLDQAAAIVNGVTVVPLRFVGEATGALVFWDGNNREISILREGFWTSMGMTKAELQAALEAAVASGAALPDQTQTLPTYPGSGIYTPAGDTVDLNNLLGMYYGFRDDFGGYECGGACWDIYTFLPDHQILVGPPPHGGPETIDCERDGCTTYTISNGSLVLPNGDSFEIGKTDAGSLQIRGVPLDPVRPVSDGLTLNNTYMNISYYGLVGINPYSSSSTAYITLNPDGTFDNTTISIASLDLISSGTQSSGGSDRAGTYTISGNTIELVYGDGTVGRSLFLVDDVDDKGAVTDILISNIRYYVDSDD